MEEKIDIIKVLNYCEKTFKTDTWNVDNVNTWPLIRIELGHYLSIKNQNVTIKKRNYFKYAYKVLIGLLHFLFFLPNLITFFFIQKDNKYQVLFLGTNSTYVKISNKWFDSFVDPLISFFSKHNIPYFKMDYNHIYNFPKRYPSLQIQSLLEYFIIINLLFDRKYFRNIKLPWYDEFLHFCKENDYNFRLSTLRSAQIHIGLVLKLSEFFEKIIQKGDVKKAFVLNYYSLFGFSFVLACKNLSVPVYDLQHGIQHAQHPAYASWFNIPNGGYKLLPDYFWVWSADEVKLNTYWSGNTSSHKAILGYNLFVDSWKDNSSSFVIEYDRQIQSKINVNLTTILYSCSLVDIEISKGVLVKILKNLKTKYNFLIRLHPQDKNKLKRFKKYLQNQGIQNFIIEWPTEFPLFALLRNIDIHITLRSTVIIEADYFSVKSLILDENMTGYETYIKGGVCVPVHNLTTIEQLIQSTVKINKTKFAKNKYNNENVLIKYFL